MAIKFSKKKSSEKILNVEPSKTPFAIVESYKNLRTNLISVLAKSNSKILAVSSSNAAEGKSTTALNIAITLAQLNKKVVILDTDSRKPSLHKKAKIANDKGCMDILLETASIDDTIFHYNNFLDVIPSGIRTKNPSELFSSATFDSLLSELEERYDYVIIDTPPINLVSDTLIIAQKCSSLVMVIRAGDTRYESFEAAYESLKVLGIELEGVIINGSGGKGGYYSKGRYNYYKYSNSYETK